MSENALVEKRFNKALENDIEQLKLKFIQLEEQWKEQKMLIEDQKEHKLNEIYQDKIDSLEKLVKKDENNIIQELESSVNTLKGEINSLKTNKSANPVPIGFVYVQLSGQSEPDKLWEDTFWQNITANYSGLFFRAEGGQAPAFGQTQEQQTKSLDVCENNTYGNHCSNFDWLRVGDQGFNKLIYSGTYSGDIMLHYGFNLRVNNEEIRPRNQSIRIWQRIR